MRHFIKPAFESSVKVRLTLESFNLSEDESSVGVLGLSSAERSFLRFLEDIIIECLYQ